MAGLPRRVSPHEQLNKSTHKTQNGTEDIWWILEGQSYPRPWWELAEDNAAMLPKN